MKIKEIADEKIVFDNGDIISYDHIQDCCEFNYADFESLEDPYYGACHTEFNTPILFETAVGGFRFSNEGKMFYVPCYSEQNGYYTADLDIYYNDNLVLSMNDLPII